MRAGRAILSVSPLIPGFVDEADLANTIAHELSHARDFQKGLSSLEGPATASGNALEEWIYGLR